MAKFKMSVPRWMLLHFLISILILYLGFEGFSHRSSLAVGLFEIPLFIWPAWFLFWGKGWIRIVPITFGLFFLFIMAIGFLTKDENRLGRRRFETPFGQIFVVQQFDFDRSHELPDKISVEKILPLGFVKTVDTFSQDKPSIGQIHAVKIYDDKLELTGDWGLYKFKHDGNRLKLLE